MGDSEEMKQGPMDLTEARLLIERSINAWVDDYAPSMGAAIAYYTLFSIAPLLILIIAIAGFFFGADAAQGRVAEQLQDQIGVEAAQVVQGLVAGVAQRGHGVLATAIGLITLFWGATSVFGEIQSALNRIWRATDLPPRGALSTMVRVRLRSFGMILGIGFLVLVSLLFSTLMSAADDWSNRWFSGWTTLLQFANFLVSFAINTGLFAMVYKFMPRARIAWRDVGIGAVVTSLLFETSKLLISLYFANGSVGSGFGAAGSLVLFLVWVYLSAQIFLLGAEFTWVYAHQRGSRSERRAKKDAALIPTRAGDATPGQKIESIIDAPRSPGYPATARVASIAWRGALRGASGAGSYLRSRPLLGAGLLLTAGVLGVLLANRRPSSSPRRPPSG